MSGPADPPSHCPNCGFAVTMNYCASCGQATHLHKDTFPGLVFHFIAHYFHFDSKFWVTVRTLLLQPGALSLAYRNKQRARFIPPISLYIFTSAMFFLVAFLTVPSEEELTEDAQEVASVAPQKEETIYLPLLQAGLIDSSKYLRMEQRRLAKFNSMSPLEREKEERRKSAAGLKTIQMLPKIFFFMVPFSAFVLSLFFFRRKDMYFADHAVFSLHFHALWFLVWTVSAINPIESVDNILAVIILLGCLVYFVSALRKTYGIRVGRAIAISLGFAFSYGLVLLLAIVCLLFYLVVG